MHVLILVKFFSFSIFWTVDNNIYGNDFLLSMQLQTTSTEATMALGGTAVEFEKPLNFYAGWHKNVLPCSNKARYKNLIVNATTSNDTTDFEWTAVELEKSLNFYAGWCKYFIIQIFRT